MFDGGYVFLISNGPFSWRHSQLDHASMAAFCSMLHANIVLVGVQFLWRNNLICRDRRQLRISITLSNIFQCSKAIKGDVGPCICLVQYSNVHCSLVLVRAQWLLHRSSCTRLGFRTTDQDAQRAEALALLAQNGWIFDNASAPFPSVSKAVRVRCIQLKMTLPERT